MALRLGTCEFAGAHALGDARLLVHLALMQHGCTRECRTGNQAGRGTGNNLRVRFYGSVGRVAS